MFRVLPFNIKSNAEKGKEFVENIVDYVMDQPLNPIGKVSGALSSFRIDAVETESAYEIYAELPGFLKEEINLSYDDDKYLTISADRPEPQLGVRYICRERRSGKFERSFMIGDVDKEQIAASFDNGILKVVLPKQQEKKNQTVIDIS